MSEVKKKLLWVGDACCPSGFAVATHEILAALSKTYDVTVLGMNYTGDPYIWPYPVYAAAIGGDAFGVGRLIWMCDIVKPDVIVIQNDGWNFPYYLAKLRRRKPDGTFEFPEYASIPVVACVAVDGKNFDGDWLKGVALAIFWTEFALKEARDGGYGGPAKVIPLGVNLGTYVPMDRTEVRAQHDISAIGKNQFIVGNVNRNQPRKRWDLTVKYFAKWITDKNVNDAWLYMHSAPTGETNIDVMTLARYYNVLDRTVLVAPPAFYGVAEEDMVKTYNVFDVLVSTTQGEGMGLPAMEAMACGIPCLLPDWSAYSEWAKDAAVLVPCTSTAIGAPWKNVIGGVVDEEIFINELDRLYRDNTWRMTVAANGTRRVHEDRFRWTNIGQRYLESIDAVLSVHVEPPITVLKDGPETEPTLSPAELLAKRLEVLQG